MSDAASIGSAEDRTAPVAVVMISLNEAHNMEAVLQNIEGWAQEIFLVDSYSTDDTVGIALRHGVHVVQRRFHGFGDQWNFALRELPITAPWTMKLDPDERLTDQLKASIMDTIVGGGATGIAFDRRLWFMGRPIPVRQEIVRVWKTGTCRFTEVAVNEHPIVDGAITHVAGELEHHDSPNLHHWYEKQNRYSTAEAEAMASGAALAEIPRLLGTKLQRRMWIKAVFPYVPFRFSGVFLYHYLLGGMWRAGWVGYAWSRLRANVYLMRHFKAKELQLTGKCQFEPHAYGAGAPDPRVPHFD